ncbi:soluble quino protein glucose/sorbosone dehydrogenase [Xylariales sp. PMI_506]|nr:soluble quino protein glucose/sorbosone dehydrogenase [Xylariales sp. PMI_506]
MHIKAILGTIVASLSALCVSSPLYPFHTAPAFWATKVAGGLTSPRGIAIDSSGRLLIVQSGVGISQHVPDPATGCITSSSTLISMSSLNHGIFLSPDGTTLYASDSNATYSWAYDSSSGTVNNEFSVVVDGMAGSDHVTRTLTISPQHPNLLVISHGSNSNLDMQAANPALGRSVIKVFDLNVIPAGGYDWASQGYLIGFGLRNDVGMDFDANGMLWSVENSADDLARTVNGVSTDVHTNNPAEELNYIGDISNPNNNFFGYPYCFTVGDPSEITDTQFQIGQQFVLAPGGSPNDADCASASRAPSLVFQAHSAPLDAKFNPTKSIMYVTLHGSWDRQPATGYKLVVVPFGIGPDGSYVPTYGIEGYADAFYPPDETSCSSSSCARPVGLAWDASNRLYMTSDSSGEVFLLGLTGL